MKRWLFKKVKSVSFNFFSSSSSRMSEEYVAFGSIADVQHADLVSKSGCFYKPIIAKSDQLYTQDDGDTEGRCQRYRQAPLKLKEAFEDLCHRHRTEHPLDFLLHLGDIVNGGINEEATQREFDTIATIFESELEPNAIPAVHVIGNHCLEAGRDVLLSRLKIPSAPDSPGRGYYSRPIGTTNAWKLIVLDTTEISGHSGFDPGSWQWKEARSYEAAHPLSEQDPQMSSWNGGISQKQLEWLREELERAESAGQRVIVAAHHQFGRGPAARATHVAWNWKDIEAVCLDSPAFALALAGHDHCGGYCCVQQKHFLTVKGMLEVPPDSNGYAIIKLYNDRIVVDGVGVEPSRVLELV